MAGLAVIAGTESLSRHGLPLCNQQLKMADRRRCGNTITDPNPKLLARGARLKMSNTLEEKRAHRAALSRARHQRNPERRRTNNRRYYWKNKIKLAKYQKSYRGKPASRPYRVKYERKTHEFLAGRPRANSCDACGRTDLPIVFDHCHQKGHFRGWLCNNCNWALGLVEDDPTTLLKLVAYLKRTSGGVARQLSLPGL